MLANRRLFLAMAATASVLAACSQGADGKAAAAGDIGLGPAQAKVTVIEYASVMCPHCREFHETIFPEIKRKYIDTGKIRFVFREFATEPREFAYAGFMIARCVGTTPQKYFDMLGVLFDQQRAIFDAARANQGREKLLEIARSAGMSEEQFNTCVTDPAAIQRIHAVEQNAIDEFKLSGTPTLIINGQVLPNTAEAPYSVASLSAAIDARLAGK